MRLEAICRVCLQEGSMKSIFETHKKIGNLKIPCSDMLMSCSTVTVMQNDGFPTKICHHCMKKLCSAYKFRQLCKESLTILLEYTTKDLKLEGIKTESHDDVNWASLDNTTSPKFPIDSPNKKCERVINLAKNCDETNCNVIDDKKHLNEIDYSNEDTALNDYDDSENTEKDFNIKSFHKKKRKKLLDAKEKSKEVPLKKKTKSVSKTMKCTLCPKRYKLRYQLEAHHDSHVGIKRYFCEICQKSYRAEKDHKKMHRKGLRFTCEICEKSFHTKTYLAIHIDTHSKDRKKIVCGIGGCEKTFLSVNGLDRHKVSHIGLKDFICHLCSKSFIDKYQLGVHIRTHTNERPFPCSFCGKMFITTSARNNHERWHTNTKNYHCKYCEKSFVISSGLKRHLLCHTKEQQLPCKFCGKVFARIDNRKRHEMAMHGRTDEITNKL